MERERERGREEREQVSAGSHCRQGHAGSGALRTHVVREVCVHENHKVASGQLEAVNVGSAQPQLARAQQDLEPVLPKQALQLQRHLVGAVRGGVLHHHNLVLQPSAPEGLIQQPNHQRQVIALIVRGQQNSVLVGCSSRGSRGGGGGGASQGAGAAPGHGQCQGRSHVAHPTSGFT